MRQIKFRGIDTMSGEMVYGDLVQQELTDGSITTAIVQTYKTYDVKPDTVGQFTGLHDKNGKEIYEGDILLFREDTKIEVKYHHGGFGYTYIDSDFLFGGNNNFDFYKDDKDDDFEVIGNIHEKL